MAETEFIGLMLKYYNDINVHIDMMKLNNSYRDIIKYHKDYKLPDIHTLLIEDDFHYLRLYYVLKELLKDSRFNSNYCLNMLANQALARYFCSLHGWINFETIDLELRSRMYYDRVYKIRETTPEYDLFKKLCL